MGRRLLSDLAPVVRRLDSAIYWIKLYPVDNAIRFFITYRWIAIYPLDSVIRPLYNWVPVNIESGVASRVKSSEEKKIRTVNFFNDSDYDPSKIGHFILAVIKLVD